MPEQQYPPYRYAADKPQEIDPVLVGQADNKALLYRTPCDDPKGQTESDLCAQWRAANAAEDSAFWTEWGFWIASVGSTLLLWQIILTRKAVEDTSQATETMREANQIAREIGQAQIRAYPIVSEITVEYNDANQALVVGWKISNNGSTPAISCEIISFVRLLTDSSTNECLISFPAGSLPQGGHLIGPMIFGDHKVGPETFHRSIACHVEVVIFVRDIFDVEIPYYRYFSIRGAPNYKFDGEHTILMTPDFIKSRLEEFSAKRSKQN